MSKDRPSRLQNMTFAEKNWERAMMALCVVGAVGRRNRQNAKIEDATRLVKVTNEPYMK